MRGPQVSKQEFDKVLKYIDIGKKEGAHLFKGGHKMARKGYFIEQTIFTDVEDNMTIAKDEVFGPVTCIMKVSDNDEAIRRANDTSYGLASIVFTTDMNEAMTISSRLEAG